MQPMRMLSRLRQVVNDIDKYTLLRQLQQDNAGLFYELMFAHTEELLPYVYTPTVGQACQEYCQRGFATRGLFITAKDRGRMLQKLRAWPHQDISLMVVTDGERILGLGDLGVGGMGISEGKSLLYTVAGGVPPSTVLPVCLDVGTNNKSLLAEASYFGLKQARLKGQAYDDLVGEFMTAVKAWRPHMLVQFEDFGNTNAFRVLKRWRNELCCFNDDMQGTAAVALAAVLAGLRATGGSLDQQTFLFLGAGEAGTAIGELIARQLVHAHGLDIQEARQHCYFIDSKGLVCAARRHELQHHKLSFAHDRPHIVDLASAVAELKPTVLVGAAAQQGAFTQDILQLMGQLNRHPFIFPLSNPTSMAECTAEDVFTATQGRAVFASGSPNKPLLLQNGKKIFPAQANNAYIFPAVGHAAVITRCSRIADEVFLQAAAALAEFATPEQLQEGRLFPPLSSIRQTSEILTARLAEFMVQSGLGQLPEGTRGELDREGWVRVVQQRMFDPSRRDADGVGDSRGQPQGATPNRPQELLSKM